MEMDKQRIIILLNPSAGKGNALKQKDRLEQLLSKYNLPHELVVTRSEENLKELTRENARRGKTLVGAGGDSTFHIMVDEIMKTGEDVYFGMIGLGSSNDISREFEVDTLEKACQALKAGRVTRIDLGCVSREGTILKYFVGQANIGLGAWVNRFVKELAVRSPRLGKIQGLAGALGIIHSYQAKKIPLFLTIESEAGKVEGPFVLAVFSNIRYWATGRMINPAARPDDGRLDACLIKSCSLPRLVRLAALSRKGGHLKAREVQVLRSREYVISSEQPFQVQADGEIVGGRGETTVFNKIQFTVIPQALNVICETGPRK
jgi:diacylglycerol kinase family enzyme